MTRVFTAGGGTWRGPDPWDFDPDNAAISSGLMPLPEFESKQQRDLWTAEVVSVARELTLRGYSHQDAFAAAMHFVYAEMRFRARMAKWATP